MPYRWPGVGLMLGAASLILPACTDVSDVVTVAVEAKVSVCVSGGNDCSFLPVPEAAVEVLDDGNRALAAGSTDDAGKVSLDFAKTGTFVHVVVRSTLIDGGSAQSGRLPISDPLTTVTVSGRLTQEALRHP